MTDVNAPIFVSYRRARSVEVGKLVLALHAHGVPTWQDIRDLATAPTEEELRRILTSNEVGSGLLFISPEVATSDIIRKVEAPLLLDRVAAKDGFFVVSVAAGVRYDEVAGILGPQIGVSNIAGWNIYKPAVSPIDDAEASAIAKVCLHERIKAFVANTASDAPITLGLYTRSAPGKGAREAIVVNLDHHFGGRTASGRAWAESILPSFQSVSRQIQTVGSGRQVVCHGLTALSAAFALGAALPAVGGVAACWQQDQKAFGKPATLWSLGAGRKAGKFKVQDNPQNADGDDLVLLVSATGDTAFDYAVATSALGLKPRATVHVSSTVSAGSARPYLDREEALDVAHLAIDAVRAARQKYRARGTIHLFMAVPAGLAFLMGQLSNALSKIQTYEYLAGESVPYTPAALVDVSGH